MTDTKTCTECGAELKDKEAAEKHAEAFHPTARQADAAQSPQPQAIAEQQAAAPASGEGAPRKRTGKRTGRKR